MIDYQTAIEKLRRDAAEAGLIRDLAIDGQKREMFNRLARTATTPDAAVCQIDAARG